MPLGTLTKRETSLSHLGPPIDLGKLHPKTPTNLMPIGCTAAVQNLEMPVPQPSHHLQLPVNGDHRPRIASAIRH